MGQEYIRTVRVSGLIESAGNILLFDDCDVFRNWFTDGTGTDFVVALDTTIIFNGDASMKLQTKATSPAAGDFVEAFRRIYLPASKLVSMELFWRYSIEADTRFIDFLLKYFDSSNRHEADIRYNVQSAKWQYLNSAGTFSDIPGGAQSFTQKAWNRLKFTIDFRNNQYLKFTSNDLEVDLTDTPIYNPSDTTKPQLTTHIRLEAETANRPVMHFDDLMLIEE